MNIDGDLFFYSNFLFRQELKQWNLYALKQHVELKILFMDVLGWFLYSRLKSRKLKVFWLELKLRSLLLKSNIAKTNILSLCNISVSSNKIPNKKNLFYISFADCVSTLLYAFVSKGCLSQEDIDKILCKKFMFCLENSTDYYANLRP